MIAWMDSLTEIQVIVVLAIGFIIADIIKIGIDESEHRGKHGNVSGDD